MILLRYSLEILDEPPREGRRSVSVTSGIRSRQGRANFGPAVWLQSGVNCLFCLCLSTRNIPAEVSDPRSRRGTAAWSVHRACHRDSRRGDHLCKGFGLSDCSNRQGCPTCDPGVLSDLEGQKTLTNGSSYMINHMYVGTDVCMYACMYISKLSRQPGAPCHG